jgi:hypothetical protein
VNTFEIRHLPETGVRTWERETAAAEMRAPANLLPARLIGSPIFFVCVSKRAATRRRDGDWRHLLVLAVIGKPLARRSFGGTLASAARGVCDVTLFMCVEVPTAWCWEIECISRGSAPAARYCYCDVAGCARARACGMRVRARVLLQQLSHVCHVLCVKVMLSSGASAVLPLGEFGRNFGSLRSTRIQPFLIQPLGGGPHARTPIHLFTQEARRAQLA